MYPRSASPIPALVFALAWALITATAAGRGDTADQQPRRDASANWRTGDDAHDLAREASERGEILPISEIFERARARYAGRVLEAELERTRGRWVYELKILDPKGRLLEVYLDAQNGSVLGHEGDD